MHIDVDDLVIHELTPRRGRPLEGAPDLTDAPTDQDPQDPEPDFHTHGLVNPDGILAAIPGTSPLKIIYEQKILDGDESGDTALPPEQRCDTWWTDYYNQHGMLAPNHDITYLRLAETTDGVYFTDLGPLQGLNDITSVSVLGTRWVATAGTIIRLEGNRYGLLYSGGNCIDADSDSFHYIGYAESDDLIHWTVVNGLNHPIASIFPVSLRVNRDGVPAEGEGTRIVTVPSRTPIVGQAQGFMAGRVYAPSATLFQGNDITVIFAGYHTGKPKNALGDYRTIARVSLHSSRRLISVGQDGFVEEEDEASEPDSD